MVMASLDGGFNGVTASVVGGAVVAAAVVAGATVVEGAVVVAGAVVVGAAVVAGAVVVVGAATVGELREKSWNAPKLAIAVATATIAGIFHAAFLVGA